MECPSCVWLEPLVESEKILFRRYRNGFYIACTFVAERQKMAYRHRFRSAKRTWPERVRIGDCFAGAENEFASRA